VCSRIFGRLFLKRFTLFYGTVVCPVSVCLSVTLVYCSQTVRLIKMTLGRKVGLCPDDIVLDGNPAPTCGKGHSTPSLFGPCLLWPNGRPSLQLLSSCFC